MKALAALQAKSIKLYAIEKLFPDISEEKSAFQELKTLLAQRVAQAAQGAVTTQTLTEIAEVVIRSRKIV